jgi:competence protein ComEC
MALRRISNGWTIEAARPPGYDRPWTKAQRIEDPAPASTTPRVAPSRDATPSLDDLQPAD